MSESTESITTDDEKLGVEPPKAIVHKQILDVAASRPEASLEAIAEEVSGANATLVEHVLDEYGDPGANADDGTNTAQSSSTPPKEADREPTIDEEATKSASAGDQEIPEEAISDDTAQSSDETDQGDTAVPDPAELTAKQRETLELIAEQPEATQADIASELGVTSPTISQRVNAIEGFDWSTRHEFVQAMFETTEETEASQTDAEADTSSASEEPSEQTDTPAPSATDLEPATEDSSDQRQEVNRTEVAGLTERLDELSEQVEAIRDDRIWTSELTERLDEFAEQRQAAQDDQLETSRLAKRLDEIGQQVQSIQEPSIDTELTERLDQLAAQIESVEQRLDGKATSTAGTLNDPELAHKVVHACFESDKITEDEELQLLQTMIDT
jgi:DNA-binding CsgD family transcriptional regulator/tetrahydromethanopterin S-methyltransferase subunit G